VDRANDARLKAHAPHSHFKVGAAVRTESGEVFIGCNVENSAFGATICAERVAVFSAVAAGHRSFSDIALVADQDQPLTPCGTCRQVLSELAPRIRVIMANARGDCLVATIEELLPMAFRLGS
jgi:cytidine deaminase